MRLTKHSCAKLSPASWGITRTPAGSALYNASHDLASHLLREPLDLEELTNALFNFARQEIILGDSAQELARSR
jgi:hypothetical protein